MGFIAICTLFTAIISLIKNYKNNILLLLSLELFFIGIALLFLNSSFYLDDVNGLLTTLFILCISATESAIGLTLLINLKKE